MRENRILTEREYRDYCKVREQQEKWERFCERHPILAFTGQLVGGLIFFACLGLMCILLACM